MAFLSGLQFYFLLKKIILIFLVMGSALVAFCRAMRF